MEMDLRKEAEERARRAEQSSTQEQNRRSSFRIDQQKIQQKKRQSIQSELQLNETDYSSRENDTPKIAQLAEIDYKWNGARARAHDENFIIPRWVPDEEVLKCNACDAEFDFVNRKHHCRHCGMIYCEDCTPHRDLVPHEFGYKDPVRVCQTCHEHLEPQQQFLSTNIANHQRVNNIDVASTNCNVRRYMNMPYSNTLGSEIRKAAYSTHNLFSQSLYYVRDKAIPLRLLAQAKGLAFITVVKGGFIFAPRLGTGLVIARLADGTWSAPSAIGTFGLSWGFVVGVDVTDYVIILNTTEAVQAFSGSAQLTVGAGVEVAVGPVGRSASGDVHLGAEGLAAAYSYSHSRGLYAGLSLEGSVIAARHEVNTCFYGRSVTPKDILSGLVVPPRAAAPLYDALHEAVSSLPAVHKVSHANHSAYSEGSGASGSGGVGVGGVGGSGGSGGSGIGSGSGEGGDLTSQTIRDIDDVLNNSGISRGSHSSGTSMYGSCSDTVANRRRTMAHVPWTQVQPTEYTHTNTTSSTNIDGTTDTYEHDTTTSSTHTRTTHTHTTHSNTNNLAPAVQFAPFLYANQEYIDPYTTTNTNTNNSNTTSGNAHINNNVTQRRRPRSLPETRADTSSVYSTNNNTNNTTNYTNYTTNTNYTDATSTTNTSSSVPFVSSDQVLGDVPRPIYANHSTSHNTSYTNNTSYASGTNSGSGVYKNESASAIDEELECVTANVNMLL